MRPNVHGASLAGTTNLALVAPVREGLAEGFEPVSYLERLRRLLDAMHSSRRNARESELRGSVFPDPIGRHGIITHFRYALMPPALVASGRWHLSLNVGFDGGWEPYMRVIYRDIGPLLDALLVHCEGYPGSRKADFDSYCRWVRAHEQDGGIFYTDSPATLADQRYLAQVESLARADAQSDRAIAHHAEPGELQAWAQGVADALLAPGSALPLHLRTLKGLYRLTSYWSGADGDILLRFARLVLSGLRTVMADPTLQQNPAWQVVAARVVPDELAWMARDPGEPRPTDRLDWAPSALQAVLLPDQPAATHGALVLLRVVDAAAAAAHLAALAPACAAPAAAPNEARCHVGFTRAGLLALGVHPERVDRLPPEFLEGMEARAGILGDLRGNHPDHWHRPLRHGVDPAAEDRIDLSVVHVAVMLRTIDPANADPALHPLLAAEVARLAAAGTGLRVLAVEPARSRTAQPGGREHFNFADGISQPVVKADGIPDPRRHEVSPGELVLGYANDRGDSALPVQPDPLLDRGSFLVVRKLRQRTDHLHEAMARLYPSNGAASQELQARMMGRRQDGTPLVPTGNGGANDFDFRGPQGAAGPQCPFASHIRRSNPRDGRAVIPRILRRGMSYGPATSPDTLAADRGSLFMAYCASIAEQFETVQRWVAGGNSTGVSSTQADPFVGVPRIGEPRVFRWVDDQGRPQRADLGDKAFVELQWGLYLFVPSLAALQQLPSFGTAPAPLPPPNAQPLSPLDAWRARLEDRAAGRDTWAEVRAQPNGTMNASPYGRLVGRAAGVFEALADSACSRVSVAGFGQRMQQTIGVNHLGQDPAQGHAAIGPAVNAVIAQVGEATAFTPAFGIAQRVLAALTQLAGQGAFAQQHPDGRVRVPVDLMTLSELVIGKLGQVWFGLPDDDAPDGRKLATGGRLPAAGHGGAPRCPGDIIGPSRAIFNAQPRPFVAAEGQLHGPKVLEAVRQRLAAGLPQGTGVLAQPILAQLAPLQQAHGADLPEREIAGLLLGFAPTIQGNFLTVMKHWIEDGTLWTLQQALAEQMAGGATAVGAAQGALRAAMIESMQAEPVPPMVWRTPVVNGAPDTAAEPVVLGLASAIDDLAQTAGTAAAREALLFGGDYFAPQDSGRWGVHACPGSRMGVGVMLGMAAALLNAGTLRPTGSPVLLMLTPKQA